MLNKHLVSLLASELISRRNARVIESDKVRSADLGDDAGASAFAFLRLLLDTVNGQYAERVRIFSQLDQKAQTTATMAAVFLAALFAFLRKENLDLVGSSLGRPGLLILIAAGSGLLTTMLLCVFGVRVRKMLDAEQSGAFLMLISDMYRLDPREQAAPGLPENFAREIVGASLTAVAALSKVNHRKASIVAAAQIVLTVSIMVVATLLGIAVLTHGW